MSARACNECGAPATSESADCEVCGASLEPRRLHENSDVRIEPARIGAALPAPKVVPDGRWARVSDRPAAASDTDSVSKDVPHLLDPPQPAPDTQALAQETYGGSPTHEGAQSAQAQTSTDIAVAPEPPPAPSQVATQLATQVATPKPSVPAPPAAAAPSQSPPRRPPVLASEALLRDIAPSRPARHALRLWCPLLGVIGAINAWFLTRGEGLGWPLAGTFCALALLGLPPMPYAGRAVAVTTVSATAMALLFWSDAPSDGGASRVMLTVAVNMLATGLLFRAWHRASAVARIIVAAGITLSSLHLWLSGELQVLTLTDVEWQSWLPRIIGLAFCLLLLLSLLAFMDARSTGGASVWAAFILIWQGLHAGVTIVHAAWPKNAPSFDLSRVPGDTMLAWTSVPLLSVLLTIALAQLLAAGLAGTAQRHNTTSMRPPPKDLPGLSPAPRASHH